MLKTRTLVITSTDKLRLLRLLSLPASPADCDLAERLRVEIDEAEVLRDEDVPPSLVTMNSKVVLRNGTSSETLTLVYPFQASESEGKVSVLSPTGFALLGHSVGDDVGWPAPGGMRRGVIESIAFQPEAAGDPRL